MVNCPDIIDMNKMTLVRPHPGMYILLKQHQYQTTERFLAKNFPVLTVMNINEY